MRILLTAVLIAGAACGASMTATDRAPETDTSFVKGALALTVRDFPAQAGVLWALPAVSASAGRIVVENTQYGSLCRFAVDGTASEAARTVTLDMRFTERLTSCTADIRALAYRAEIDAAPGTYDVFVVHHQNDRTDTLARRTVTLP